MTTDMAMETVMDMQTAMMAAATGVTVGTAAIEPFSPPLERRPIGLPRVGLARETSTEQPE